MDAVKAFQDALQYLKSSDFSAENTPSFRSDCFHSYGVSLLELNEVAQALTLFSKATKANRRNSQVPSCAVYAVCVHQCTAVLVQGLGLFYSGNTVSNIGSTA